MLSVKPRILKPYTGRLQPIRRSTLYRRHSCVRKELIRQWLVMELGDNPKATITGRVVDINLGRLYSFDSAVGKGAK